MGKVADFFKWVESEKKRPEPKPKLNLNYIREELGPDFDIVGASSSSLRELVKGALAELRAATTEREKAEWRRIIKNHVDSIKEIESMRGSHVAVHTTVTPTPYIEKLTPEFEDLFQRFYQSYCRSLGPAPSTHMIELEKIARASFLEALTICDKEEATVAPEFFDKPMDDSEFIKELISL